MRTPLEIVAELKNVTHWSQPNVKFNETMALLNELEAVLNTPTEVPTEVVEEPIVEETPVVEEPTVEEPVVEETQPKKSTKKK